MASHYAFRLLQSHAENHRTFSLIYSRFSDAVELLTQSSVSEASFKAFINGMLDFVGERIDVLSEHEQRSSCPQMNSGLDLLIGGLSLWEESLATLVDAPEKPILEKAQKVLSESLASEHLMRRGTLAIEKAKTLGG